jgi:hypothetical protein
MARRARRDRPVQIGGYYLSQRPGSAMWCRTWFDPITRQTRRSSLGTDDPSTAEKALAAWVAREVPTVRADPSDVELARVVLRYDGEHIRKLGAAGAAAQRRSLRMVLEYAAGYNVWTVKRAFSADKGRSELGLEARRAVADHPVRPDRGRAGAGARAVDVGAGAPVGRGDAGLR